MGLHLGISGGKFPEVTSTICSKDCTEPPGRVTSIRSGYKPRFRHGMDALQRHLGTVILREEVQGMVHQHTAQSDLLSRCDFHLDGCSLGDRKRVHLGGSEHGGNPGRQRQWIVPEMKVQQIARQAGLGFGETIELSDGPGISVLSVRPTPARYHLLSAQCGRSVQGGSSCCSRTRL